MLLIYGVTDGVEAGQECCSSMAKGRYRRDHGVDDSRGFTGLLVFQIHTKQLQMLERGRRTPGLFVSTTAVRRWRGLPRYYQRSEAADESLAQMD